MSWLPALPMALACLAVFWVPGTTVLVAARMRDPLLVVALAPAVSAGVAGAAAAVAPALRVHWGLPALAAATLLTALAVALTTGVRRGRWSATSAPGAAPATVGRLRAARGSPPRWATPTAITVTIGLQAATVAWAMGRPDRIQNAWDALFHLAAVQQVRRTGLADPGSLAALASPTGGTSYYPHAWHALASLVPQLQGPVAAVNTAALLPCIAATVIGVAALGREALPGRAWVAPLSALAAASGLAMPIAIALQPALVANAFGLALVPGTLASVVATVRGRTVVGARVPWLALLVAAAGIATVHPGAFLSLLVGALPWMVGPLRRLVHAARRSAGVLAAAGAVTVGAIVAVQVFLTLPAAHTVLSIWQKPPVPAGELATRLLTGDLGEWSSHPIAPVVLTAVAAVTLVRRRTGRAIVVAAVLGTLAYTCAASSIEQLAAVTGLWYHETRRIAPLIGMLCAPLVAVGALEVGTAVASLVRRASGAPAVAVATATTLVLGSLAASLPTLAGLTDDTFSQAVPTHPGPYDRAPYLSPAEETMIGRLAHELDPNELLLGSSFSGSGHLAALTGQRVIQPYHSVLSAEAQYVSDHLAQLDTDPGVCRAVRELGARYVWVDPYPLHSTYWHHATYGSFTSAPPPGTRTLDSAGPSAVYALDVCW